jgi:hypothetical protein
MFIKNNKVYDVLKFIAQIALPGAGTLYVALSGLWDLPNADEVVGTVVAVDTFLGLLLGLSAQQYNNSDDAYDGDVIVHDTEEGKALALDLNVQPDKLLDKKSITFKVKPAPPN